MLLVVVVFLVFFFVMFGTQTYKPKNCSGITSCSTRNITARKMHHTSSVHICNWEERKRAVRTYNVTCAWFRYGSYLFASFHHFCCCCDLVTFWPLFSLAVLHTGGCSIVCWGCLPKIPTFFIVHMRKDKWPRCKKPMITTATRRIWRSNEKTKPNWERILNRCM